MKYIANKLGHIADSANSKREAFLFGMITGVMYLSIFLIIACIFI